MENYPELGNIRNWENNCIIRMPGLFLRFLNYICNKIEKYKITIFNFVCSKANMFPLKGRKGLNWNKHSNYIICPISYLHALVDVPVVQRPFLQL